MKLFSLLAVVCGLLAVRAADIEKEENVLVLTDDNFDGAIKDNKFILVEFYAPWCVHCVQMDGDYKKAATQLLTEMPDCKLAKFDGDSNPKVNRKMNIKGYPTMIFWKGHGKKKIEYHGGRTATDIVAWLKKKTGPPTVELASEEAFTQLKKDNEVAVVGFFADAESADFKTYVSVADSFDDVPFFTVKDVAVAEKVGLAPGKVALFKQFDEGRMDYEGEMAKDAMAKFVKENQLALLTEFSSETAPKIFGGDIQNHALLFVSKKSEDFATHTGAFKTAAKEFKGQMLFIFIDSDQEENKRVMEFFGLTDKDCPTYRIIKMSENMAKYKPDDKDLSAGAVTKFAQGVLSGVIKRHLMTEEVPEGWNKEAVAVLVGKNFKEVAYDTTKKVFVEFYAPWCGHCKSLAPIWKQLGEKFQGDDSVMIAKMDATANEVEDFEIQGFPTLKFFPSGSDKVLDYSGDRTLEAMAEYVKSNGEKVIEPKDGVEPPTEPFYANDIQEYVQAEGDEGDLEEFDNFIEKLMKESMPSPMDEQAMLKDLEEQMKVIMESIEKSKKAEAQKSEL